MTELDKVIDALERCLDGDEACPGCYLNDYAGCRDKLNFDALAHLTVYRKQMQSIGEGGELIRRSDLLKFPIRRNHYDREHGNLHFINGIETVMEYAEYIPAVEAEPVVHAHWICDCEPYHICSNCRHKFSLFDRVPRCPNCGAHMDEEVAE